MYERDNQLGHSICEVVASEKRQAPMIAPQSAETAFGFQKLVVNILDVGNPHIKEHIADLPSLLEKSFLGEVQDCTLS